MKINRYALLSIFAIMPLALSSNGNPELPYIGIVRYDESDMIVHSGLLKVGAGAGPCPLVVNPDEITDPNSFAVFNWPEPLLVHGNYLEESHIAKLASKPVPDPFVLASAASETSGTIKTEANTNGITAAFKTQVEFIGSINIAPLCPYPPGLGQGCAESSENCQVQTDLFFKLTKDAKMNVEDFITAADPANVLVQMNWYVYKENGSLFRQGELNPLNGSSSPLNGKSIPIPKGKYHFRASFIQISNTDTQANCSLGLQDDYFESFLQIGQVSLLFLED